MANTNAPYGLRPVRSPAGNVFTNEYKALNSTRIREGDLLSLGADGYVDVASDGPFIGVAASQDPSSIDSSTVRTVPVYDDPNQLFSAQQNDTAAVSQAIVGDRYNADLTAGTLSYLSGHGVDVDGGNSASFDLLVTGFDKHVDNEVAPYAKLIVKIMNHAKADV